MTRLEELEVQMQGAMSIFLEKKKDRFIGYDRLLTEINTFAGYQLLIVPMIAKQSEVTTGITADKLFSFTDLGMRMIKVARKALVFANDNNNQALAAIFTITISGFKAQSQTKMLIQAQAFLDALEANAEALAAHNVGSDVIKAVSDSILDCRRQVLDPTADSNSKTAATKGVKKLIKAASASLAIIDELVLSEYDDTDPDFIDEYFVKRQIDAKGIRHTGLTVTFTNATTGSVIESATVSIALLGKTAVSNISGVATIPRMKTGTYHIDFSASGYTAQTQDITVPRSRTVELAVMMVAL